MMQQGDYNSIPYYSYPPHQNPNPNPNTNPNPIDLHQSSFASAPPYSSGYFPSDYPTNFPPYAQNSDPVPTPPVAPSYTNTQSSNPTSQSAAFPSFESHAPSYHSPAQQPQHQTYYPPFDQPQPPSGYAPSPPPVASIASHSTTNPNPIPNSSYSSLYSAPYSQPGASVPPAYDNPYENSVKYDQGSAFDDSHGNFNRSRSDLGSDPYGKSYELGRDDGYGDGVYAYNGGKVEPYGARGTASKSWSSTMFDDYGRSISVPSGKDSSVSSSKIVKAVPKADTQQDMKSGVQKFRVKLLAESYGQTTVDVFCQIALDGIRMLDPSTNRTLRIYPLENITRCEVMDSTILAFWSKSSVDIEPRRIRLQSNSYTTNTLLDTVTAATVQLKEMGGGRSKPSEPLKMNEQSTERKKGIADWVNLIKPGNEEKDHWVPDEAVSKCISCGTDFGAFVRKHHCRNCGDIFCVKCTQGRIALTADDNAPAVRVCDKCMAEVTQRLSNTKESASKPAGFQSHEDLARKLQEEMEKNRKASSGLKSDGSGRRMKEVACPICTVHLQVQVPSSGSETIECGVCQHPFLVSSH